MSASRHTTDAVCGTIGAVAPEQACPIGVKDAAGNLVYPTTDISGNINVNVAAGGGGGGGAMTVADGADVAEGATTDAAVVTDANGTVSGKLRGLVKWAFERMPASLGQKLMAASFPVVIASDQSGVPVTGTFFQATQPISAVSLPLPTGAATLAGQTQPGVDIGDVTVNNAGGAAAVNIQDGGNSITVDGTITANQGTPAIVGNAWPSKIVGADLSTTAAVGPTNNALYVQPMGGTGALGILVDSGLYVQGLNGTAPIGFIYDDVIGSALTENNIYTARVSASRAVVVQIEGATRGTYATLTGTALTIAGTVTANAGTNLNTSALALSATQTDRSQFTKITDGTRDGTIKAASTLPLATDTALVVTTRDTVTVSGTVTTTPPANQSVNVAQIAGTNTVTGGVAGLIAVAGNVANAVTATSNPVPVGGVFTTTPATLTTGQTATAQFTAAQNLKQDISTIAGTAPTTVGKLDVKGADGDVFVRQATASNLNATVVGTGTFVAQVTGSVTANAGTNLNTSLLALDTTVGLAQASATAGERGPLVQGAVTTLAPGYASGTTNPLSLTTTGALRTDGSAVTQNVNVAFVGGATAGSGVIGIVTDQATFRVDAYTSVTSGTTVVATSTPYKAYAIQVKGTGGTAVTWDVRLEGSLNNVNFSTILQHTNTTGDGAVVWSGAAMSPALYFRSRCAGIVLGTASDITATVVGIQ